MGSPLSPEQIAALAPDTSSISAAKKLAKTKNWQNTGQSSEAIWGDCQGSALYQIRIEVSSYKIQCTCPSHKQPCKHGLALLMLANEQPEAVPEVEQPEWINQWLTKRASVLKRKETIQTKRATGEGPTPEQMKAAEKRLALVKQGIEQLDLWLSDLIRNGLGSLSMQAESFWQPQIAQMVDAQAPGLAARLRRISALPNSRIDWPERLLEELGELTMLTEAFQHLEELPPELQGEIRQMIGWSLTEDEVSLIGERVEDSWLFLGQQTEAVDRGHTQRIWLLGRKTGRSAMLSQFKPWQQSFPRNYPLGDEATTELIYWPGTTPQRAFLPVNDLILQQSTQPILDTLPGLKSIKDFLLHMAEIMAQQPWRNRFLCVVQHVTLQYQQANTRWWIRDQQGFALPVRSNSDFWKMLAISGGKPVDVAAEWDGEILMPLGFLIDHNYVLC